MMAKVSPASGARATGDLTREHVLIPWETQGGPAPRIIDHAQGCDLYTSDGTRILDFSSGLVNVNIGHSHPRVVEAIRAQAGRLTFVNPSFSTDVRARLAQMLARLSPGGALVKTFFTNGGAEANENAVKIARLYTGRHKVLTSYRGYHGATYGAITMSGDPRRWPAEPGVPGVVHFLTPYPYRSPFSVGPAQEGAAALAHLEHVLMYEGPENVAAILIETIVGGSGLIVPPDGYLEGLRKICDRHGILLIFDEVMAGFGRTGAWFACEHWNVVPDMLTFAKGVTSGYVPLGGVLVSAPVARYFDDHILWAGLTYSGHALACAAGCANLEVMEDEGLVERARRLEGALGDRLRRLADRHPVVGDVRGKGLFWGVELVKDRGTREPWAPFSRSGPSPMKAFLRGAFDRGVYLIGRYNIFLVAPPLVISEEQIEEGVQAIDGALAEAAG
ncbi:MAG TPA: aminotransferase class III-fold pyridoxal phosphate-dependent enzyme [bacterium]|nr:aminotransferase class III-fold pyridoxal phosphate-dependent enzyme [bacterium]